MELHDMTRKSLKKLAVSKSRTQRGAVVHNAALDFGLQRRLKTMDCLKAKSARANEFDQEKFLGSLSTSSENLTDVDRKITSSPRRPKTAAVKTVSPRMSRSKSVMHNARRAKDSGQLTDGISALELYDKAKRSNSVGCSPGTDRLQPYSISSNMKVSESHHRQLALKPNAWTPRRFKVASE
jgi:hypothetical protein